MKRFHLLLASTTIPMALLLAPDLSSRVSAQTDPAAIEASLDEAGLDSEALEALAREVETTEERVRELRGRAQELTARAGALATEADALQDEADTLAAAPDSDAAAIEEAAARAAGTADAAEDAAEEAADARAEAEAAEREAQTLRERLEAAEREAREIRERAAEEEAGRETAEEVEQETEGEAEREAEREAAEEAEREAAEQAEREAVTPEAEDEVEVEAEAEAEAEAEGEAEAEAEAEAEVETEVAPEREAGSEADEPEARDPAPAEETVSEETVSEETAREEIVPEDEPLRFQDVREGRRERVEEGVTITEEPGARTILQEGDQIIIRQAEEERVRRTYSDVRRERRGDQEVHIAPREGDVEIITILDTDGNLVRRIRREADGTETVLIDNTRPSRSERDRREDRWGERRSDRREGRRDDRREGARFGYDGSVFSFRIDIPPPVLRIPQDRYVVDYGDVYEDDLADIFSAPPVAEIHGRYTLDEVRYNPNLRDYMARVDLDTVTFDTGSWSLSRGQVDQLDRVAQAMNQVIDRNPEEIFLIEGHTDAIGRAIDNLSLSDRRAESVAYILTRFYDVPPENLVTQGYGEEYLKIDTRAAERRNRRVTIRRITPLIAQGPRG